MSNTVTMPSQKWNILLQPKGSNLCGQSCVAMVCGFTLDQSISLVGKRGLTKTKDLTPVINQFYNTNSCLTRLKKIEDLPTQGLLKVTWKSKGSHWVLIRDGFIYDPAFGCLDLHQYATTIRGKITSFLELKAK